MILEDKILYFSVYYVTSSWNGRRITLSNDDVITQEIVPDIIQRSRGRLKIYLGGSGDITTIPFKYKDEVQIDALIERVHNDIKLWADQVELNKQDLECVYSF